jgi:hypothetical protein
LAQRERTPAPVASIFESLRNGTASKATSQFAADDVIAVLVIEDGVFYDVVVRSEN